MLKKLMLVLISSVSIVTTVLAEISSEVIDYQIDGQAFQGYISYDDAIKGKRPGVIVVHEWWGHNAYARKRADMLAKMGYTSFAVDMYGTGKLADRPDNALKFMQQVLSDINLAETRFNAALHLLQQHPVVKPSKLAAIGCCFGGGTVLQMARVGTDLAGVVNYPGVKHSFTNPEADDLGKRFDMPLVYDAAADKDSWQWMQVFLEQVFSQ
jgi:dienelactone hydrolase